MCHLDPARAALDAYADAGNEHSNNPPNDSFNQLGHRCRRESFAHALALRLSGVTAPAKSAIKKKLRKIQVLEQLQPMSINPRPFVGGTMQS